MQEFLISPSPARTNHGVLSYLEREWEPDFYFENEDGNPVSYSRRGGTYIKNGKLVTCFFEFLLSSKGSSTGRALLRNFPFPLDKRDSSLYGTTGSVSFFGLATSAITVNFVPYTTVDDVFIKFTLQTAAATNNQTTMLDTDVGNGTQLAGTVIYRIA